MVNVHAAVSLITLDVNEVHTFIKRQSLLDPPKQQDLGRCGGTHLNSSTGEVSQPDLQCETLSEKTSNTKHTKPTANTQTTPQNILKVEKY